MKILLHFCLVLLLTIGFAKSKCAKRFDEDLPDAPLTDAQNYFNTIPHSEHENFIRYYLAEGLREVSGRTISKDAILIEESEFGQAPQGFARSLVGWTQDAFQLDDDHIEKLIEDGSVDANGVPIRSTDVGCHCCPF